MTKCYKAIVILILFITVGCAVNTTEPPEQKPPASGGAAVLPEAEAIYQVAYIAADNEVYLHNTQTGEVQAIYTSAEPLDIIIPNPTMKVIALTTKDGSVKIYDCDSQLELDICQLESVMPLISWSPDGCYLMIYQPSGNWGSAIIYDFVNNLICSNIMTIGEPIWNPDSNRICTNIPEQVDPPVPYGDGQSSSVVVYNLADNLTNTILKGDDKNLYRPLKWLAADIIAFEQVNMENASEEIYQMELNSAERTNISDRVHDLLYTPIEAPSMFYNYQYFEFTPDNKYALLCTVEEDFSKIDLWNAETEEVTELAEGYCASWVSWK